VGGEDVVVIDKSVFRLVVDKHHGNVIRAARELDMTANVAYYHARKLGIKAVGNKLKCGSKIRHERCLMVAKAIVTANGNMADAAIVLGISRERVRQLFNRIIEGPDEVSKM